MVGLFTAVVGQKESYFVFYPNPVVDEIKILPLTDSQYTITDIYGKMIRQGNFSANTEEIVNLADLQAGVFSINLIIETVVVQSEKMVKI
jgi:hypothetical protein